MDTSTALVIALVLCVALWVPFFMVNRKAKGRGHTWFTWWKPRGHSDIGPDVGFQQTRPGVDEARGTRY